MTVVIKCSAGKSAYSRLCSIAQADVEVGHLDMGCLVRLNEELLSGWGGGRRI